MKYSVDMRKTHLPSLRFGSLETYDRWLADCNEALEAQTVAFAVAPLLTLETQDGRLLRAGSEIRPGDLHPREWQKYVASGSILAKPEPEPEQPEAVEK